MPKLGFVVWGYCMYMRLVPFSAVPSYDYRLTALLMKSTAPTAGHFTGQIPVYRLVFSSTSERPITTLNNASQSFRWPSLARDSEVTLTLVAYIYPPNTKIDTDVSLGRSSKQSSDSLSNLAQLLTYPVHPRIAYAAWRH